LARAIALIQINRPQKEKTFLRDADYKAYLEVVNANNSPASLHDSAIKLQHFVESKITH
jgi:hypothetical protein